MSSIEWETRCRDTWFNGAMASEEDFGRMKMKLVKRCRAYAFSGEMDNYKKTAKLYYWVEPYCVTEPLESSYEHGVCLINLAIAEACVSAHNWDSAYDVLGSIHETLDEGDRRREIVNVQRRPNSEIRYRTCQLLAEAKYFGPECDRDRLMTPELVRGEFSRVYGAAIEYLDQRCRHQQARRARNKHALAWANQSIVKMATRWMHKESRHVVEEFNRRHGHHLAIAPHHYQGGKTVAESVWYWDYEFAKLVINGCERLASYEYCHEKRVEARLRDPATGDPAAFIRSAELEIYAVRGKLARRRIRMVKLDA